MAGWEDYYWEESSLTEFKAWFTDVDGFGSYLQHFLAHYGHFFREHEETHAFIYTKLHKEFSKNLENAVDAWLSSKGLTQDHLDKMLQYAKTHGDAKVQGIVDALLSMLEYTTWIAYILNLKQDQTVPPWFRDEYSQPGWDTIGGAKIEWNVKWWETWSDTEWDQYWAEKKQWSEGEWEGWWAQQDTWNSGWEDKSSSWTNKTWTSPALGTGGYAVGTSTGYQPQDAPRDPAPSTAPAQLTVSVPDGVTVGSILQVQTPDGQVLTVSVPEGVGVGETFVVPYTAA